MSDDKVGYGKPPVKTRFQKGKSGNPRGRPKRRNPPKEPLDAEKVLVGELKSLMTINVAGKKKKVAKLEAVLMTYVARAFHDKATMKDLLSWIKKLPKEAFADEESYTYRVNKSQFDDLVRAIEQDVATWSDSSEATNSDASPPQT
jgi:hypothetical protein